MEYPWGRGSTGPICDPAYENVQNAFLFEQEKWMLSERLLNALADILNINF